MPKEYLEEKEKRTKHLEVSFTTEINKISSLEEISGFLDRLEKNPIAMKPWPDFDYKPDVSFAIAHHDDCVFIKYYVQEDSVQANYLNPNEPVYKDSCVEFFIGFEREAAYYNLEFNCLGTCLLGYGTGKENRELLPEQAIKKIRYLACLKKDHDIDSDYVGWELTLMIPISLFQFDNLSALRGKSCYSNFFKCGDELPKPHFLSWTLIESPRPDFHQPEFFGVIQFK